MSPKRSFDLVTTNKRRTKALLTDPMSTYPSYELDFTFITSDIKPSSSSSSSPTKHSLVMRAATPSSTSSSPENPILAVADISFTSLSNPITFCLGDPTSPSSPPTWHRLSTRDAFTAKNLAIGSVGVLRFDIDLGPDVGPRSFAWKRTSGGEGGGKIAGKLDWLHLKMVEEQSGEVVAWFRHSFMFGKKRGTFVVEEYKGGKGWEELVLGSGVAVLEYTRKMTGWSL